jgi:hypothetical protein
VGLGDSTEVIAKIFRKYTVGCLVYIRLTVGILGDTWFSSVKVLKNFVIFTDR